MSVGCQRGDPLPLRLRMTGDCEHGVQSGGVAGARSANFTVKAEAPRRMECLIAIFLGMRPAAQKRTWVLTLASPHRVDYKQPQQDELQDQRLERTWFGSGAEIKLKALSKAKELSANWN